MAYADHRTLSSAGYRRSFPCLVPMPPRMVVVLFIAAVLAAPVLAAPASAAPAPVELYWYPGQSATFSSSEYAALGITPSYVVYYACSPSRSSGTLDMPLIEDARKAGVGVLIKMDDSASEGCSSTGGIQAVAAGEDNAYLKQMGSSIARYDIPVQVTYDWEMNGSWYDYSDVSPATWIKAWNTVTTQVDAGAYGTRSAKGLVTWVWNPNTGTQSRTDQYWSSGGQTVENVGAIAIDGYLCHANSDVAENGSCPQTYDNTIKPQMDADHELDTGVPYFIGETAIGGTNREAELNTEVSQAQSDGVSGLAYFQQAIGSQNPLSPAEEKALGNSIASHW